MSRCLSAPDATFLPTSLPQEQATKTKNACSGKYPTKGVLESYFQTLGKYLLFTTYLTSTNMPTAQQKKGQKYYWSHTAQIREVLLYVIIKSLRLCNKISATFK